MSGGSVETSGQGEGDGDGDPATGETSGATTSTGDGDGDGSTGDGDGDPTGDGDGDATGDGDGDGEDSATGGDPCIELGSTDASDGANAIDIPDNMSALEADCGAAGPEQAFIYTASATALVEFEVVADVETSVYLLDLNCDLETVLACAVTPDVAQLMMEEGESVYVIVDSMDGAGTGTLTITPN